MVMMFSVAVLPTGLLSLLPEGGGKMRDPGRRLFSIECLKSKTSVIILANHKEDEQSTANTSNTCEMSVNKSLFWFHF